MRITVRGKQGGSSEDQSLGLRGMRPSRGTWGAVTESRGVFPDGPAQAHRPECLGPRAERGWGGQAGPGSKPGEHRDTT